MPVRARSAAVTTTEGFNAPRKAEEVEAGVDVGRIRRPKQHGVRRFRRPAWEIGGTKIGGVELGSGYLGDAVDAADPGGGGIPALPSRQRLARGKSGLLGDRQARHTERNAARHRQLDELASRGPHASHHLAFAIVSLSALRGRRQPSVDAGLSATTCV